MSRRIYIAPVPHPFAIAMSLRIGLSITAWVPQGAPLAPRGDHAHT